MLCHCGKRLFWQGLRVLLRGVAENAGFSAAIKKGPNAPSNC